MAEYLKKAYKYDDRVILRESRSMTTVHNFALSFFEIWKKLEL